MQSLSIIAFQQLNGIFQQIIIKIFINMQQKMKCNLFRIHNLFNIEHKLINISVLILAFDYHRSIESWNEIFGFVGALPTIIGHDLLDLVVYIVYWSSTYSSIFKETSSKHGDWAQVVNIYLIVIVLRLKPEFGLSDGVGIYI